MAVSATRSPPESIRTCSSAESERDCAKVEVARSNRARSTKQSYGVAELERRESLKLVYVGSNPTSVALAVEKLLIVIPWRLGAVRSETSSTL